MNSRKCKRVKYLHKQIHYIKVEGMSVACQDSEEIRGCKTDLDEDQQINV